MNKETLHNKATKQINDHLIFPIQEFISKIKIVDDVKLTIYKNEDNGIYYAENSSYLKSHQVILQYIFIKNLGKDRGEGFEVVFDIFSQSNTYINAEIYRGVSGDDLDYSRVFFSPNISVSQTDQSELIILLDGYYEFCKLLIKEYILDFYYLK